MATQLESRKRSCASTSLAVVLIVRTHAKKLHMKWSILRSFTESYVIPLVKLSILKSSSTSFKGQEIETKTNFKNFAKPVFYSLFMLLPWKKLQLREL